MSEGKVWKQKTKSIHGCMLLVSSQQQKAFNIHMKYYYAHPYYLNCFVKGQ